MVRINYHHRMIMSKRRIPALDGYMDRINLLLWPRFKVCSLLQLALQIQAEVFNCSIAQLRHRRTCTCTQCDNSAV